MNQRNNPIRLAALAAALMCVAAAPPAPAQRRPRPSAPTTARRPAPEARAPQTRRAEPERPFEELLPAEGYGLYVEVRRVGSIFELGDMKTAFAAMRLVDANFAEFAELSDFVTAHAELLADARILVAALPARPGLPLGLVGLQLPTPEAAAAFEPKYRAFLIEGAKSLGVTPPAATPPRASRGRAGARQSARPRTPASRVVVKRSGSWLLASDKQFNPARLRAEGGPSLAESQRFQSLRSRFSSEQLFVYFDINRTQEAWAIMQQQEAEERARAEAAAAANVPPAVAEAETAVSFGKLPAPPPAPLGETRVTTETAAVPPSAQAEPTPAEGETKPEEQSEEMEAAVEMQQMASEGPEGELSAAESAQPSEQQVAAANMDRLMRNLWGGIPRIPNAAALAVGLEGGTLAVRVAVENPGGGPVNLIPFLPNVISGAPVTTEAAQVAPADGGVFVAGSLDWPRIFDALLGTAKEQAEQVKVSAAVVNPEDGPAAETTNPTVEETLAQVEKFFGFKLREDFLPTLGSEVAVSIPLEEMTRGFRMNPKTKDESEKKDAEPGIVALVALNDPEKAARLLPRVLTMLGVSPLGGAAETAVERREGFEIRNTGGIAYGVINNFLVFGQVENVRHVADEAAAHRTLAATPGYRDATGWQAKQKLVQAYVSDGLMRHTIEESKRQAAGSTDPVVLAMLAQLEAPPEGASLASTTDGDLVLHELRLPLNLIKVFGASAMIGMKEAPVIGNEMSAAFMLSNLRSAQINYRSKEGRERYGSVEELVADGLLDEHFASHRSEYAISVTALGDKFEVTATPKQYGKTGRRSFFLDESGVIRAADHKGKPASAQDPPID
jgi:hypothetical protein